MSVRRPLVLARFTRLTGFTRSRRHALRDAGMVTAEYAVATLAACGFAGLLLVVLRSDEMKGLLLGLVRRALAVQ